MTPRVLGVLRPVLISLAAALLLAACRADFGVRTDVRARGAGRIALTITADADSVTALEGSGLGELAELLRGRVDELRAADAGAVAATIEAFEAAGWDVTSDGNSVVVAHDYNRPAELSALAADLAPVVRRMELTRDVGIFRSRLELEAEYDFRRETIEAEVVRGVEAPPTAQELERVLGAPIADLFRLRVEVAMAGDAVVESASTAPDATDGAFAWDLAPGDELRIVVATGAWNVLGAALFVAAVVLFVAAVVLGVMWFARTRRPPVR